MEITKINQVKLAAFVAKVHRDTLKFYNTKYPNYPANCLEQNTAVNVKPGRKYTKVDVGGSGKYMVVNETGEIFGIKAYGVIHRGHAFGTLDTITDWNWGGYRAMRIHPENNAVKTPPAAEPVQVEQSPPESQEAHEIAHNTTTTTGELLANLLHLKKNSKGRYDTAWGDKTALGLYLTIKRVIDEGITEL